MLLYDVLEHDVTVANEAFWQKGAQQQPIFGRSNEKRAVGYLSKRSGA